METDAVLPGLQSGGIALDTHSDGPMPARMEAGPIVWQKAKPVRRHKWTCQFCGQLFEGNYNSRYCSPAHKQAAYRERKRTNDK
jgi:hypothetical protein